MAQNAHQSSDKCSVCTKTVDVHEVRAGFESYNSTSHNLCKKHMVDFKHAEIRKKFGAGRGVINQRLFAEKLCNTLIAADNDDSEAQQLLDYMYTHVSQVTRAKNHKEFSASEINSIQKLKLLAPNSTQFFDSVAHEIFAHKKYHYSKRRFTPILLSGEPGVGKTFATQLLADHLNIDHGKIQVSTMNSGFEFSGLSTKWKTPTLGYLLKILITFESHTGIIILDELDKFSASREHGSLYDALLYLLEEDTCDSLVNELFELPLHTKDVLWVATANNLNKIPEPVLSRFKIIHINNLTKDQAIKITDNIYRKLSEKWKKFGYEIKPLSTDVYNLANKVSIRELKKILTQAVNRAAFLNQKKKIIQITKSDFIDDNAVDHVFNEMTRFNSTVH